MNRREHLQWCKNRANEYVDSGDYQEAMSSMCSDLRKHPETIDSLQLAVMLGVQAVQSGSKAQMKEYINGFN